MFGPLLSIYLLEKVSMEEGYNGRKLYIRN